MRIALHYLENQGRNRKKVLILSDMFQSGLPLLQLNRKVEEMINRFELDQVIAIGEGLREAVLKLKAPQVFIILLRIFCKISLNIPLRIVLYY